MADSIDDARSRHFYDPDRRMGQTIAPLVGMPAMVDVAKELDMTIEFLEGSFHKDYVHGPPAAFDTVLFYLPKKVWHKNPPEPSDWYVQLHSASFPGVNKERFRYGKHLEATLAETIDLLLDSAGGRSTAR